MNDEAGRATEGTTARPASRRRFRRVIGSAMLVAAAVLATNTIVGHFMSKIQVGDRAPAVTAVADNGQTVSLADYLHRQVVVLYFYPKDGTTGCTAQACGFRDAYQDFVETGAVVIGVSGDTVESHQGFIRSQKLPFLLLSDADGAIRQAFGVPKTLGIVPGRVTYVIDREGIVRHVFNSQFFAGRHVTEALKIVRELANDGAL
jgi:peroxiredoxin Q/BCP